MLKNNKPSIISLPGLINVFAAYSLLGWIYEQIIAKFGQEQIVQNLTNYGPFKPYYGLIGVIITILFTYVLLPKLRRKGIVKIAVLSLFLFVFSSIIISFVTSFTLDKALNIKVWDLSKNGKENFQAIYGVLSGIKYGVLGGLSLILVYPGVTKLIMKMGRKIAKYQSLILAGIMFSDTLIAIFNKLIPYIKSLPIH